MAGTNSAADRFERMGLSMDYLADSAFRIAEQSETAVARSNAENVGAILRALGSAMDAALHGAPGALEAMALDAAEVLTCKRFRDAMEARLAEAVPVLAIYSTDEQEGE